MHEIPFLPYDLYFPVQVGAFNRARDDCEHVALSDLDIDAVAELDTFYNFRDEPHPSDFSVDA